MQDPSRQRTVLAYSGGLDTTVAIPWLTEELGAEVVTVTLDIGQGGELADIRERALAAGAVRAHVIDAREQLLREYVLPAVQAGALDVCCSPLNSALADALIAKRLIDVARMEGASAIAHGDVPAVESAGANVAAASDSAGNVHDRLDALIRALDPSITVIVPECIRQMSEGQKLEYARARGIPVPASDQNSCRIVVTLLGRSTRSTSMVDRPEDFYVLTRAPANCPEEPAYVEIEFDAGLPVRANGIEMPLLEMLESLEIIAGAHGVGRLPIRYGSGGLAVEVHEAPAAVVLQTAHAALERLVTTPRLAAVKQQLARVYADAAEHGAWYSDVRAAIDAFVRAIQPRVTGAVRLMLSRGECRHDASHAALPLSARLDHAPVEGLVS